MGDTHATGPDHRCLFETASEHGGYFTAGQARVCGFSWALLSHHVKSGRLIRIRRGLYRLSEYPSSPREDVLAAWLAVGKETTLVSHESALDLFGLSDVIPDTIHLTVPRTRRHLPKLPGVTIHTTTRSVRPGDIATRDGLRLTAAARSILDAAEAGTAPEQIELAVSQAIDAGLTTTQQLEQDARERGSRVARLITAALGRAAA